MNLYRIGDKIINADQIVGVDFTPAEKSLGAGRVARIIVTTTAPALNSQTFAFFSEEAEKFWGYLCSMSFASVDK